jgi:perosamine synthetase
MRHVIWVAPPEIDGTAVRFAWSAQPEPHLYAQQHCMLDFGTAIDPAEVPSELWWRIALILLHPHWAVLRPCTVVLPVALPEAEREFWLRCSDAAVATLEAQIAGRDTRRAVDLVGQGLPLGPPRPAPGRSSPASVSCFSGGRDGTTQAAMLAELGAAPLLVAVTSPVPWSHEHDTPRRRQVLEEITERGFDLIEVRSDLRSALRNDAAAGYGVAVNELCDTFLYLAAAVAVAAARGARRVMIASEAEVQENLMREGTVVQARHFMYSAVTLQALSAVLAPAGISVGSLTHSLHQFQVQRLLAERYGELRDLQYSCWSMAREEPACSECRECRSIALNLVASGVSPTAAGIDLVRLLDSLADWHPGDRYLAPPSAPPRQPLPTAGRGIEMQEVRAIRAATPAAVGRLIDGTAPAADRERAMAIFAELQARARALPAEPEPGYRAGYLDLLEPELASGVRAIIEEHFAPAPPAGYAPALENARRLISWITAPLTGAVAARPGPPLPLPAPREPIRLDEDELAELGPLLPAPEPQLTAAADGRIIPVADTRLDGNEAAYVADAVRTGWISSAGAYVRRLEEQFAVATGCRHAVACSSGTAALHLALAAAGIEAGDDVIVPAFTMIATAHAARYLGAGVELADADLLTWNIDPARVVEKLGPRTRAIVAVHTYGLPADMDALAEIARRNGLRLIEDAAEAHGATRSGRCAGSLGDVAAFSLYGNKILTSGEGGLLTTDDDEIAAVARELRDHAFSPERHFWHRRLGFNYRMTNLQAAVALAQLERLDALVSRRRENARRYRAELGDVPGVSLPPSAPGDVSWMFGITVEPGFGISRDELRRVLAARGIETRTFFVPLHVQPVLRHRFRGQRYPVAERLGATGLYLPSGPGLTAADIAAVAEAVRDAAGRPSPV